MSNKINILCSQTLSTTRKGECDSADLKEKVLLKEYKKKHYTPLELIVILKDILEVYIHQERPLFGGSLSIEHLIEECEGWTEDETIFEAVE